MNESSFEEVKMKTINKNAPVLVTGATGYVAGWLVKKLLDEGHTVHAPVRDPKNAGKLQYLNEIAENSKGTIKYFKADLLENGSYNEAMKGCELVFHTASPFIATVKDPQKDLVDPALLGTKNVLKSVEETESVKRVVLTSSCAAIFGDAKDLLTYPNGKATEKQWNTSSNLDHQAYCYSKTVAEKAAWEIARGQNRWDMVVINPSLVIGPGINPNSTSESFTLIKQLGDGTMKMGVPDFSFGLVDVRDLGVAHYKAGYTPEANGRNIVANQAKTFLQLAQMLSEKYGKAFPFPKGTLPKWLVWLMGPVAGAPRKMIAKNVGYPWKFSNVKGIKELGITYRPIEESIIDFFQQMIDNGIVKAKGK